MNGHLYRSRTNKMVAGVCGGIAEYFRIDPSYVYQDNRGPSKIQNPKKLSAIFGAILIIIGAAMIAKRYFRIDWLDAHLFWPIVLIAVGILVIYGGFKNK